MRVALNLLGVLYLFAWWACVQGDPPPSSDSPAPGVAGGGGWGGACPGPPPRFGPLGSETTQRGSLGPQSPRRAQFFFGGYYSPKVLGLFSAPSISNSGKGIRVCNLIRVNKLGF